VFVWDVLAVRGGVWVGGGGGGVWGVCET